MVDDPGNTYRARWVGPRRRARKVQECECTLPLCTHIINFNNSLEQRVIASICWHAFLGSRTLQVRPEVRIRTLKRRLQRDLFYLWDLPANIELAPVKAHTHASAQSGVELEFRSMKL